MSVFHWLVSEGFPNSTTNRYIDTDIDDVDDVGDDDDDDDDDDESK